MNRNIVATGLILGIIAIILGAFAAHGLERALSADAIATFETGVQYQMYNALFLLLSGTLTGVHNKLRKWSYFLTLIGTIFFSGSIYFLATNTLTAFDFSVIGLVTPIGGTLMIAGWTVLLVGILKLKKK